MKASSVRWFASVAAGRTSAARVFPRPPLLARTVQHGAPRACASGWPVAGLFGPIPEPVSCISTRMRSFWSAPRSNGATAQRSASLTTSSMSKYNIMDSEWPGQHTGASVKAGCVPVLRFDVDGDSTLHEMSRGELLQVAQEAAQSLSEVEGDGDTVSKAKVEALASGSGNKQTRPSERARREHACDIQVGFKPGLR